MKKLMLTLLASAAVALPVAAQAQSLTYQAGSLPAPAATPAPTREDLFKWEAANRIVGVTSTATTGPGGAGGDPIYHSTRQQGGGIVALIMNYGAGGSFICSGTLITPTRVLSAAHCFAPNGNFTLQSTTAFFYNGSDPNTIVSNNPISTAIVASGVASHPLYTGQVIDENDIAVVALSQAAPNWATVYDLYTGPLGGAIHDIAGYGRRSDVGGTLGANLGTGRLREGSNRLDFRFGDADFGGFFTNNFFGTAAVGNVWVTDFDNGLAANDASCRLAVNGLGIAASGKYCDLGTGAREVTTAGGDSGGPTFIDGKVAAVTSFGLTFGTSFGDIRAGLNSSFGEFSGVVPVSYHQSWIAGVVPEPATWAMMIGGFGLVGGVLRRRALAAA